MTELETLKIHGNQEAWVRYRRDGSEDCMTIIPSCIILKAITEKKYFSNYYFEMEEIS